MPTRKSITAGEFIALLALLISLTALSIDAMLPALGMIGKTLGVQETNDTQLIVSLFILGMVAGELLFGAVADAYGRRPAILLGLFIYTLGTVLALAANSLTLLLAGRIIQGIGVAGPKIGARALIRDQYEGAAMARVMSLIMMIFILVPMIAPAYGQILLLSFGWRAIFAAFLVQALLLAIWFYFRQAETLPTSQRIPLSLSNIVQNLYRLIQHRQVLGYTLIAGLIFGMQVVYLGTAQTMFADFYQIEREFPLYFALLASAIGLASWINTRLVLHIRLHSIVQFALLGMLTSSVLLAGVGWLYAGIPPLSYFMGLCFILFACLGLLFGNINVLAMQPVKRIAGLGAAFIASFSSLVAVLVALLIGRFYDGTVFTLALGFATVASLSGLLATHIIRQSSQSI